MKKKIFIVTCIVSMVFSSLYAYKTTTQAVKISNLSLSEIEYYSDSEGIRGAIECEKNCNGDFWGKCNKATLNGTQTSDCQNTSSGGDCCGIKTIIEEY